jgi:hypothetical protein
MRAVWSFWSKPYYEDFRHCWIKPFHHALAWSLSLQEASKHYPDTWLYTDTNGARLLVDRLQLPFANVCTSLDALDTYDSQWWALGKLHTYRLQQSPFVHIDNDVFLWLPLPAWLTTADVFSQNPEPFTLGNSFYKPEKIEDKIAKVNGWLPQEWKWFRSSHPTLYGYCCGLLGGSRPDFIQYYSDLAFQIIEHQANYSAMRQIDDKMSLMIVLEQFLLAACIAYHNSIQDNNTFKEISTSCLFNAGEDLFKKEQAARAGYTHLLGDTKRNSGVVRVLEERMLRDNPEQYERCRRVCAG